MASTESHTDFCTQSRSAYYEKKATFLHKWTHYCRTCGGLGGEYIMFDPSPAGVGLGGGHMTEFEWCHACLGLGNCPRCNREIDPLEDMGAVKCQYCNWSEEAAEMDVSGEYCLPPQPECHCFAPVDYDATRVELEQLTELEIDLANDPDRQARQDDVDGALSFILGSNDNDEEGD